ncbi:indolepyruvate ferredoxin oxidoreductase family protein [Limimaricola cinnabarinus]|uniref:Indolepyruvate ferredoxin oxidoreductase, alpha and beta subunits n=1 Tax=Limimaricola cinnabarinus LL-001 TaxID=1337093 RepID=U3AA25_9RHOB|nr:indolepyruvate ferredoxin oxidoreductase family protein [Limimaricola cinnabarinus]GAD54524.1 indolepyruvate ferredoxin oxidoreductase, alpha and beta subunits [Limimaricola cinnabarinus LL-001]
MTMRMSLDDKYTAETGHVFLTGIQALVRLPMTQMRRDRAAGLNTGTFISGYRGSPLGGYDQQLMAARKHLDPLDIVFQPGVNEDLAATAVWGSQQLGLSEGARKDGLLGLWYGKGPGVDRSGDVLKHANAAGTSANGGVLAFAGDDHTCKSSSIPHQSDHAFISALMPMLYPSSVHEFLELGLLGIAMSRYSGCWVGYKVISETVETSTVVDLGQERRQFLRPTDFEMPEGGLNLRWPDAPLDQDERLQEYKGFAALAFARANRVDQVTIDTPDARFGIVASGKAYEDVRQALAEMGLGPDEWQAIGLRLYKVRMPWPLEPEGIRHFSEGLEEVLIVEERREIIENQIKQQLFNWRADVRPRIIGKHDEKDRPFLSLSQGLTVGSVGRAIADRLLHIDLPEGLHDRIEAELRRLEAGHARGQAHEAPITRLPHYCPGCPHNTSTKVPEGSKAMAGIGCHYMVQWMDRNTETFTHMGAEGVPWTSIGRFTDEKHRFVNLGDGTFFHSGHLAIRQSVAARANITYKILYNDAVAMTGGQKVDGPLSPEQVTHQVAHENVARIVLLSDHPESYDRVDLAPGTEIRHRDDIDAVMKELREIEGVTVMVYVQTCAAELRRRRKRGRADDPDMRVHIDPAVCEGCGDCSVQSNCIAVEPLETELGRKRQINQSACNKDFSCLKGFCPSFVTVRGAGLHKRPAAEGPDVSMLSEPQLPEISRPWNIAVTGVGGTGVLTIGALLGVAAHMEGLSPMILDMAGLAQKGGAVLSHIRISTHERPATAPRIATGTADLLLAADSVVAASKDGVTLCDTSRTHAVMSTKLSPTSDFVRQRDFDFRSAGVMRAVENTVRSSEHFHDFAHVARELCGDEIAVNIMMLGYAWQQGFIPVGREAITQAVRLNGVAVQSNLDAFNWGRVMAAEPKRVIAEMGETDEPPHLPQAQMTLDQLVAHRTGHLTAYQDARLARRYTDRVARVRAAVKGHAQADKITRAVAQNYAKLLSCKDEYEVARLFTRPEFSENLKNQFDGDYRIAFNLAPPGLPGTDAEGRPKKREFGPWILKAFGLLARGKRLRGTAFDVFGRTEERKRERALIGAYEADMDLAQERLGQGHDAEILKLLELPDQIRGFGPVKLAAMEQAAPIRDALRAVIKNDTPHQVAAE